MKFPTTTIYENGKHRGDRYANINIPSNKIGGVDMMKVYFSLNRYVETNSVFRTQSSYTSEDLVSSDLDFKLSSFVASNQTT